MLQRSVELPPPPSAAAGDGDGNGGNRDANVDRQLYRNLVEMVPLVESLMDRRVCSAYSRRAPMVYTPAPPKSKKASETQSIKEPPSTSKSQKDPTQNSEESSKDQNENVEKYMDEIAKLHEQMEDLKKKLTEKEEDLKIKENKVYELSLMHASLNELKIRVNEKEALLQSTNSQLNNAKILLADKEAVVEKLEYQVNASNCKMEELQDSLNSLEFEINSFKFLFEKLSQNDPMENQDFEFEPLPILDEKEDEINNERLEEQLKVYLGALNAAKENPCEESLNLAIEARLRVCSFISWF